MKNVILRKHTIDGSEIEIVKNFIGYSVYDGGCFVTWKLTLSAAKEYGDYLSGCF